MLPPTYLLSSVETGKVVVDMSNYNKLVSDLRGPETPEKLVSTVDSWRRTLT